MATQVPFQPRSDREQAVLDSYDGLTRQQTDQIIAALASNGIDRERLLEIIGEERAFSVGLNELLKQRPYGTFHKAVHAYGGPGAMLRTRVLAYPSKDGARLAFGEEIAQEFKPQPRNVYHLASKVNDVTSRLSSRSLRGLSRDQVVPIAVPMLQTIDQTFELLHDAVFNWDMTLLHSSEFWRDRSPTRECGVAQESFTPNRVATMWFGIYEPKPNETFADVKAWMSAHGASFASYECFAAILQYPEILNWLRLDPRGGRRGSSVSLALPTVRHPGLAPEDGVRMVVSESGPYGTPRPHALLRDERGRVDNSVFPFVLPPEELIDPAQF